MMMSDLNKSDSCDKVNNRTHHTRFFEKLYGNLDKTNEKKSENFDENLENDFDQRRHVISPSESSVSSNETSFPLDNNFPSSQIFPHNQEVRNVNLQPPAMFPNHFGSLRIPFGFPPDSHNHFAAFRK